MAMNVSQVVLYGSIPTMTWAYVLTFAILVGVVTVAVALSPHGAFAPDPQPYHDTELDGVVHINGGKSSARNLKVSMTFTASFVQ